MVTNIPLFCMLVFKINPAPGPGTYESVGVKKDGVYAPSHHKRTKTPQFKREVIER